MAKYNVRLANPYGMWFQRTLIMDEVGKLFFPAAKKAGFEGVNVTATLSLPTLLPGDVLIYLMPNEDYSLIEKAFGEGDGDPEGRTIFERGASEVYIAGSTASEHGGGIPMKMDAGTRYFLSILEPEIVAMLVFHEAMHNKLKWNTKLHHQKGPATALFRKELTPHSRLSEKDIALMASVLKTPIKQWDKGWHYVKK